MTRNETIGLIVACVFVLGVMFLALKSRPEACITVSDVRLTASNGETYNIIVLDDEPDKICISRVDSKQLSCFSKDEL